MPFAPAIFGSELAHILNTLAALQAEESKRFTRHEHMPLMATFTHPVGTSWFEADMLTRHFYANQASLESLLASDCVSGARETFEWRAREGLGLSMLQARQMLLSRFVEVASSLQPAMAPGPPARPPRQDPVTRWPPHQQHASPGPVTRWPPHQQHAAPHGGLRYEQYYEQLRRAETTRLSSQAQELAHGQPWASSPSRPPSRAPSEGASLPSGSHPPNWEARTIQASAGEAMDTGSQRQSPGPPSPVAGPAAPPRREPRWLLPRADSVPPKTPESEGSTEQRAQPEQQDLTDAGWFSGEPQDD
jgi:hypothetical protein